LIVINLQTLEAKPPSSSRKVSSRGTSWHPFLRKLTVVNAVPDRDAQKKQRITAALVCFKRTTGLVKALVSSLWPRGRRLEERPRPTIAPQTEASVKISKALVPEYRRPSSSDQFEQGAGSMETGGCVPPFRDRGRASRHHRLLELQDVSCPPMSSYPSPLRVLWR
jgi:hypothetical protein